MTRCTECKEVMTDANVTLAVHWKCLPAESEQAADCRRHYRQYQRRYNRERKPRYAP